MSNIIELFERIREYVPEDDLSAYNLLYDGVKIREPEYHVGELQKLVSNLPEKLGDAGWDDVLNEFYKFQDIHDGRVVRHENVSDEALKSDSFNWFSYVKCGVDSRRKDLLEYLLDVWPSMFTSEPGRIRQICFSTKGKHCHYKYLNGRKCVFRWIDGDGSHICPKCDSFKRFCESKVDQTVCRCKDHKIAQERNELTVHLNRATYYVNRITNQKVRQRYIVAAENAGLSLDREIALLRMRLGDLVEELDDETLDYKAIHDLMVSDMRRLRLAIKLGDVKQIKKLYEHLYDVFSSPRDNTKHWKEIRTTTQVLQKLTDSQQIGIKRNSESITLNEMIELMRQTSRVVEDGIKSGSRESAAKFIERIQFLIEGKVSAKVADKIMNTIFQNQALAGGLIIQQVMMEHMQKVFENQKDEQNKAIIIEQVR